MNYLLQSKAALEVTDLLLDAKTRKRHILLKYVDPKARQLPFRTVQEFNDWLLPEKVRRECSRSMLLHTQSIC